jgi:hypothetical protein
LPSDVENLLFAEMPEESFLANLKKRVASYLIDLDAWQLPCFGEDFSLGSDLQRRAPHARSHAISYYCSKLIWETL